MSEQNNQPNEFDEWAKRFEPWIYHEGFSDAKQMPATCMYPIKEGPHYRACGKVAPFRSPDNRPVCGAHQHRTVRPAWRGYVEGA